MRIGPMPESISGLFPEWKFILQKDEDGTRIASLVPNDRSGKVTDELPKGSGSTPNAHPDWDTRVEIIEGMGLFHYLGYDIVYYPGSTFDVETFDLHGFVDVWTKTVFTKTITDELFEMMQERQAANQAYHYLPRVREKPPFFSGVSFLYKIKDSF